MSKSGWEAKLGGTFTPPSSAESWTDEFNQLLEQENTSRNKLTSKLIADGLKYRKLFASANDTNVIQAEMIAHFFKTQEGQKMIVELLSSAMGVKNENTSQLLNNTDEKSIPVEIEIESKHPPSVETEQKEPNEPNEVLEQSTVNNKASEKKGQENTLMNKLAKKVNSTKVKF